MFRRFIGTVPAWALALVFLANFVNTVYFYYLFQVPDDGHNSRYENGQVIYDYVNPGGPADKAGMKSGDILLSVNSIPLDEWTAFFRDQRAGDSVIIGFLRNGIEMEATMILGSKSSYAAVFLSIMLAFLTVLSIASLFIIYKKPHDTAAALFFIYIQLFIINQNAGNLPFQDYLSVFASILFCLTMCITGPVLIHFHLVFPNPANIYMRFKRLPLFFYSAGLLFFFFYSASFINVVYTRFENPSTFNLINIWAVRWLAMGLALALLTAIYQFLTKKDSLFRNQLRVIIFGSVFAFHGLILYSVFPGYFSRIFQKYPYLINYSNGIGSLIMIACILIAIFRYRIWGTEIFIRKALLYLSATSIIILSYLLSIFLIDRFTHSETNDLTRFVLLAVSVVLFLVMRDRIQHLIDRLFHRESYDSATVVSDFEEKLAGTYHFEELKSGIAKGLDEIFHFKSLVFNLKKDKLIYGPAYSIGLNPINMDTEYSVTPELERRLQKSQVFSPAELDQKLPVPEIANGELIVPLIKENQPYGFFLCGPKKSEKTYSLQDIRVLSLIAKRVIALFNTASLYQKDLDRQLMLERERARISQDMHDDVGASLTRISILSDLAKNKDDITGETRQWLGQISDTSRGVMEEMSQIIWALNPVNDSLAGLIAYLRRFVNEFMDPTPVDFAFDLPETLPDQALSVEVRRNIYLVVREALHNVVKHSGAAKILISMKMNEHGFSIIIKDDGRGFDPGKLEFPGNGLVNMKKRMNDIGGEFKIRAQAKDGTEIELVVLLN
jgi:signal transduction histidine kinase